MGLLERFSGRLFRKEPLSEVARGMGFTIFPGKCAACGASFSYPSKTLALPWKPELSTIDIGGYCKRCDRAVCSLHVGVVQWTVGEKTGWSPSCGECGMPLFGLEEAMVEKLKRTEAGEP